MDTPVQKSVETNQRAPNNAQINPADFQAPSGLVTRAPMRFTAMHFVFIALALMSLLFMAFISLARSVEVSAIKVNLEEPSQFLAQLAEVRINSALKLPLGNRVLLLPGDYQVAVSAPGFQPIDQILTIGDDRNQQFEIELQRLPGELDIQLSSLSGEVLQAKVTIDGRPAGTLPGIINEVAAGKREITVDAPLYRPITTSLLVKGKGEKQSLNLSLQAAWAEYQFSSSPPGARVLVDQQKVGQTPLKIKLEEGTRQLVISADNFKDFTQEIGVVAGEDLVIPSVTLTPADGELSLSSTPAGAAIILNGEFRGVTPMTLAVPANSQQNVKVYKAGYQLSEQGLSLEPNQKQQKQLSLVADIIPVKLSVAPNDASVYVDGALRGTGSQTLNLSTLPHKISVRKAGYVSQNVDIIPSRRNTQIISMKLLTEEQHYWAQVPNTYVNGLGHEMKLFRDLSRSVKMGSSRREDGRRANEVVYQAELSKPFYVALHETTNKQFRAFRSSHNSGNYKAKSLDAQKAPVANISWQDAARYCNWLSKQEGLDPFYQTTKGFVSGNIKGANGYRLLTEVEWAWLARNKGAATLRYPWGNNKAIPAGERVGNFADKKAADILAFTLENYDDGYKGPSPVGRFAANHRGLFDIGGNVSEWVNDWYSSKGNSELNGSNALRDPLGPDIGEFHVVRGGSWAKGHLPQLRLAYRDYAAKGKHDIGFRIARYAGLNKKK